MKLRVAMTFDDLMNFARETVQAKKKEMDGYSIYIPSSGQQCSIQTVIAVMYQHFRAALQEHTIALHYAL